MAASWNEGGPGTHQQHKHTELPSEHLAEVDWGREWGMGSKVINYCHREQTGTG